MATAQRKLVQLVGGPHCGERLMVSSDVIAACAAGEWEANGVAAQMAHYTLRFRPVRGCPDQIEPVFWYGARRSSEAR